MPGREARQSRGGGGSGGGEAQPYVPRFPKSGRAASAQEGVLCENPFYFDV